MQMGSKIYVVVTFRIYDKITLELRLEVTLDLH